MGKGGDSVNIADLLEDFSDMESLEKPFKL